MNDYQILKGDDGNHYAHNGRLGLTVADAGQIFKRRAIKNALGENSKHITWLVGELAGVRVYIQEADDQVTVVMTADDLYP